jgi:hypothetical protein
VKVRLTHLDGKLPNLALMKLSAYHKQRNDEVYFSRNPHPDLFEPQYHRVYGSTIFTRSAVLVERLKRSFPDAIVGGTGLGGDDSWRTVEQFLGVPRFDELDYSIYPDYPYSIGFSMRGCRLACGFCVVARKEGKPRSEGTLSDIWRGDGYPKNIVLLDNDFFGQPRDVWQSLLQEAHDKKFRINFNQGINVRLVRDDETAQAIARSPYWDDSFKARRLHTAFDNARDEPIFRAGVERLLNAGVPGRHIMTYMLVGYDQAETEEDIMRRFRIMLEYGVLPYPMVYQRVGNAPPANSIPFKRLKQFQRWVIRRYYQFVPFMEYESSSAELRAKLNDASRLSFGTDFDTDEPGE